MSSPPPQEKTHGCAQCPKKFGSRALLAVHMKTHERVLRGATFRCTYCGKGFFEASTCRASSPRAHSPQREAVPVRDLQHQLRHQLQSEEALESLAQHVEAVRVRDVPPLVRVGGDPRPARAAQPRQPGGLQVPVQAVPLQVPQAEGPPQAHVQGAPQGQEEEEAALRQRVGVHLPPCSVVHTVVRAARSDCSDCEMLTDRNQSVLVVITSSNISQRGPVSLNWENSCLRGISRGVSEYPIAYTLIKKRKKIKIYLI
ncbi:uncharacterized protein LOC124541871 [Vanessa cardui]|uniref:uncharacterized protein LOC124541871 n=1 Tax=Vanessa cardui TaxID=171605 RepID=UPI001F13E55B|nr:uncharacterized protein LOC124541871 [Vanessa cardui]